MIKKNKLEQNKRLVDEIIKKYYFEGVIDDDNYYESDGQGDLSNILLDEGFISDKAELRSARLARTRRYDRENEYVQLNISEFFQSSYTHRNDSVAFLVDGGKLIQID